MTARSRLPNRRLAETFELEVAGLRYTATVGRFSDGRLGEIFLNNTKSNSAAVRLQHRASMRRRHRNDPQGAFSGRPRPPEWPLGHSARPALESPMRATEGARLAQTSRHVIRRHVSSLFSIALKRRRPLNSEIRSIRRDYLTACPVPDIGAAGHRDVHPMIALDVGSYPHRNREYGRIKHPLFTPMGWALKAVFNEALAAAGFTPEAEPPASQEETQAEQMSDDIPF